MAVDTIEFKLCFHLIQSLTILFVFVVFRFLFFSFFSPLFCSCCCCLKVLLRGFMCGRCSDRMVNLLVSRSGQMVLQGFRIAMLWSLSGQLECHHLAFTVDKLYQQEQANCKANLIKMLWVNCNDLVPYPREVPIHQVVLCYGSTEILLAPPVPKI